MIKLMLILVQFRLNKGKLCPARLGKGLGQVIAGLELPTGTIVIEKNTLKLFSIILDLALNQKVQYIIREIFCLKIIMFQNFSDSTLGDGFGGVEDRLRGAKSQNIVHQEFIYNMRYINYSSPSISAPKSFRVTNFNKENSLLFSQNLFNSQRGLLYVITVGLHCMYVRKGRIGPFLTLRLINLKLGMIIPVGTS